MLITCKFHLSGYVVPPPIVSNGLKLYSLGDARNHVYLYATMFKGMALMNVRKVTNARIFSKEGITFNSWEVDQFRKLRRELELAIAESARDESARHDESVLESRVHGKMGKYKLIRYHVESQIMELIKIRVTDDRREYEDVGITLNADEMRAFFGTFARVDVEFRQLIANLEPKVVAIPNPSAVASIEKLHQADNKRPSSVVAAAEFGKWKQPGVAAEFAPLKRKASSPPTTTASTFQKRIATLQAEAKVPKLKIDLTKANNM